MIDAAFLEREKEARQVRPVWYMARMRVVVEQPLRLVLRYYCLAISSLG
jgi:hypothetical protein